MTTDESLYISAQEIWYGGTLKLAYFDRIFLFVEKYQNFNTENLWRQGVPKNYT